MDSTGSLAVRVCKLPGSPSDGGILVCAVASSEGSEVQPF